MTRVIPTGRATSMSLAEFNARAKRVAASTGEVEKGSAKRAPVNRWRKEARPAEPTEAAEPAETAETAASESE